MQSQKNDPSKIHYNVTRPVVAVTDTNGKGDFNVSPIGFPLRNHDSEGINPTLIQPQFDVSYTDFISGSTKIDVTYTENNLNVSLSGLYTAELDIVSITRVSTVATVTTLKKHGFIIGSSVSIYGADQLAYTGTYTITTFTDYTFTYTVANSPITPATGTMYLSYSVLANTIIHAKAQTDTYTNGIYRVSTGNWQKLLLDEQIFVPSANTYEYDGTENDNSEGSYVGYTDENGDSLTHFRKGYSHGEVESFLKNKLNTAIEFGRFRGSERPTSENGGFVNWLLKGRSVNIGGNSVDQQVIIDGFGLGDPENTGYPERTNGAIDPTDYDAVALEREYVKTQQKTAIWGISNTTSTSKSLPDNKSPMLKDYPFIYNTESEAGLINSGGHIPASVNENNLIFNVGVFSGSLSTGTSLRPFNYSSLFYNRQNGYHNNITLDVTKNGIVGKHSISIIHNLDTPDLTREFSVGFNTQAINTTNNTIHVDDVSVFNEGDAIVISRVHSADFTSILPSAVESAGPLHENFTYFVYNINVGANTFQLRTANSTPAIDITDIGSFSGIAIEPDILFIVSKLSNQLAYHAVTNNDIYTQLLNVASITLSSGLSIIKTVSSGTISRFLYKPRSKYSITGLISKGSGWTSSTLTYDNGGDANTLRIYLESTETDYITLHDYTLVKTTADLLADVLANNDLIPMLFNASQTDERELSELYAYNTLDVHSDTETTTNIHSKKTFIHLPTPIDLKDGTVTEIDISIPVLPNTDAFSLGSVGSISGYKNFITQPRAYVLSGYQKTECININGKVQTYTVTQGNTTVLFGIPNISNVLVAHGIHTYTCKSNVNYKTPNSIKVPYGIFAVGDVIKLFGTLPTGLVSNTAYIIYSIESGFIQLSLQSTPTVLVTFTESVIETSFTIVNIKPCYIYMNTLNINSLSGEVYCNVYSDKLFTVTIPVVLTTSPTPYMDKIIYVEGTDQIEGLTERSNSNIFGNVPEASGVDANNISHQQFKSSSISNTDKRILLATVYPTASNTFSWRIDKDPTLSMLQWNLSNIPNLGDTETTPTPAMIAYERNRTIRNQYPDKFNFDIESNPLTYATSQSSEYSYQSINSYLRVQLPSTLGVNDLTEVENSTTGSYEYQARKAHKELIKDFLTGKVRVNSRKDDGATFESDVVSVADRSKAFQVGYDTNCGSSSVPTSFFSGFIDTSLTEKPNVDNENGYRWITKALYNSSDIVNAENNTIDLNDPYNGTSHNFKSYLGNYFSSDDASADESNASNRYIPGSLHSPTDPTYPFAVGYSHSFIDFLTKNSEDPVVIDDIRRQFWDSSYVIPQGTLRQMQNAFHMSDVTSSEDIISFYGNNWVPFSKVFSTDLYAPDSIAIDDIDHDASNSDTLLSALKSNPIAYKYFDTDDYTNAFTSLNITDTDSDLEEFMRGYVGGYANNMPTRFYNNYRSIVSGLNTATAHSTDTDLNEINTESDVDRIFSYSVAQYLASNGDTPPSVLTGHYLDDNFVMSIVDNGTDIVAEDYNPSWWYFENGNPVADAPNSKIKTDIIASGMNYLADAEFYRTKMKYSYVRYTMKFIFSRSLGRWMTLDYRQAPTTYLTPTIGNEALSYREKSYVIKDNTSKIRDNILPIWQPSGAVNDLAPCTVNGNRIIIDEHITSDIITSTATGEEILVVDIGKYTIGDTIRLYGVTGTLFTSTPQMTVDTNYRIRGIAGNSIKLSTMDNQNINISSNSGCVLYVHIFKYGFTAGEKISLVAMNDYQTYDVSTVSGVLQMYGIVYTHTITTTESISTFFGSSCKVGVPKNTISNRIYGQDYFMSTLTGDTINNTQYLWESTGCNSNTEKYLLHTPYFMQDSLTLNKTCYQFLHDNSLSLYTSTGDRNPSIKYDIDNSAQWLYRFDSLENPTVGINFIVPNNVHGGKLLGNSDLFLFQPNTWNVYYHIRPAISCMDGTDIPSPTARTDGVMADATLNSMFSDVNSRYPAYVIPWHENQSMSWVDNDSYILESQGEYRTGFDLYDANITSDPNRLDFVEIEHI